jgi:hypothetical protein
MLLTKALTIMLPQVTLFNNDQQAMTTKIAKKASTRTKLVIVEVIRSKEMLQIQRTKVFHQVVTM